MDDLSARHHILALVLGATLAEQLRARDLAALNLHARLHEVIVDGVGEAGVELVVRVRADKVAHPLCCGDEFACGGSGDDVDDDGLGGDRKSKLKQKQKCFKCVYVVGRLVNEITCVSVL